MPWAGVDFSPAQDDTESEILTFDFKNDLATGETISTATWTCSVVSGTDPNAAARVSGSASISGSKVSQLLTAGVAGVLYRHTATITTSLGQTLSLWAHLSVAAAL